VAGGAHSGEKIRDSKRKKAKFEEKSIHIGGKPTARTKGAEGEGKGVVGEIARTIDQIGTLENVGRS